LDQDQALSNLAKQSQDPEPLPVVVFQEKKTSSFEGAGQNGLGSNEVRGSKGKMLQIAEKDFQVPIPSAQEDPTQLIEFLDAPHFVLIDASGSIRGYYSSLNALNQIDIDIQKLFTEQREQSPSFWHSLQWYLRIG